MNSIRLIKQKRETRETAQAREIRKIRERRTGPNVPQGEGEIDNTPLARTIDVDEVCRSYRLTDEELRQVS